MRWLGTITSADRNNPVLGVELCQRADGSPHLYPEHIDWNRSLLTRGPVVDDDSASDFDFKRLLNELDIHTHTPPPFPSRTEEVGTNNRVSKGHNPFTASGLTILDETELTA